MNFNSKSKRASFVLLCSFPKFRASLTVLEDGNRIGNRIVGSHRGFFLTFFKLAVRRNTRHAWQIAKEVNKIDKSGASDWNKFALSMQ